MPNRIWLRPLSNKDKPELQSSSSESKESEKPDVNAVRYHLDVRFVLSTFPSQEEIKSLAQALRDAQRAGDIKANSILWKDLHQEGHEISVLAAYYAYKWMRLARSKESSRRKPPKEKSQVTWGPILGKRPRAEITLAEVQEHQRLETPSKRTRASSKISSRISSLPSPPTTSDDSDENICERSVEVALERPISGSPDLVHVSPAAHSLSSDQLYGLDDPDTSDSSLQAVGVCADQTHMETIAPMRLDLTAIRQWNERRIHQRELLRSRIAYKTAAFANHHNDPSMVEEFRCLTQNSESHLPAPVARLLEEFLGRSWISDEHRLVLQAFANLAISYESVKLALPSTLTKEQLTFLVVKPDRCNVAEYVSFEILHLTNYVSKLAHSLKRMVFDKKNLADYMSSSEKAESQGLKHSEWILTLSAVWEETNSFLASTQLDTIWSWRATTEARFDVTRAGDVATRLQTIANAIDLISIATLDGHTGDLWNAVSETETLQIELPFASHTEVSVQDIEFRYSAKHLECLYEFTGGRPVWVMHSPSAVINDKLYLSVSLDVFAKIWGPAWAVYDPSEPGDIQEVRIRRGVLEPRLYRSGVDPPLQNGEKLAHWTSDDLPPNDVSYKESHHLWAPNETVQQINTISSHESVAAQPTVSVLRFRHSDRLLIGARTHSPKLRRRSCRCSPSPAEIEGKLNRKGVIHRLGTCRPYRYCHSQQIGGTVGSHATITANHTYMIDPGQSLSQILLTSWENDPHMRHTSELEDYCGLIVSACTFNALRVRYVDLLNTPTMRRYLKVYQWKVEVCKSEFFRALDSDRPRALTTLWETHPEWREEVGDVLMLCIKVLSRTGYDPRRNELEVLWICEGQPFQWGVSLRANEHNWIGSLRHEQCSMAVAVLIEDSLYTKRSHSRLCGDDSKHTVLETAYTINENAKGYRDLRIIHSHEAAETVPWRIPDKAWEQVWSVKNVPTVFDGKLGRDFPVRGGSRLSAIKRLTKTHLLTRWSPQHFEFIRRPIFGPITEPEGDCHWEQVKDLSNLKGSGSKSLGVRPLPLHIC